MTHSASWRERQRRQGEVREEDACMLRELILKKM